MLKFHLHTFFWVLIVQLFFSRICSAQQFPQFALFADNLNTYNPAVTGVQDYLVVNGAARYQWIGMNGSPFSQSINAHTPLYKWRSGAGVTMINSQQGLQRNTSAGFNYAYMIRKKNSIFSLGVRGGVQQSYLDGNSIITPEGSYEAGTINHNDPILPQSGITRYSPDFALGLLFTRKTFFLSFSSIYLSQPFLNLTSTKSPTLNRHYVASIGKRFKLGSKSTLANNYLIKYDQSDLQAETNLIFRFKQSLALGLGYRASSLQADALMAFLGLNLSKKWSVSYAYEFPMNAINKVSIGSQEILITYKLPLSTTASPGKIIYTPRF